MTNLELRAALIAAFPPLPITRATIHTADARWADYEERDALPLIEGKSWVELAPEILERHAALLVYAGGALYRAILLMGVNYNAPAKVIDAHQSWRACPSSHEPRRQMRPQVAARSPWSRVEALLRNRQFVAAYREARERWIAGALTAFPIGTYWLRRFAHVPLAG
ncbi:MAG TPA: hypothetical protein VN253_21345 [Kofleriaceae bacterium]|nr:hypothetical protein [Kofleriaceae bacterium]